MATAELGLHTANASLVQRGILWNPLTRTVGDK
jgi:hypothetical protein